MNQSFDDEQPVGQGAGDRYLLERISARVPDAASDFSRQRAGRRGKIQGTETHFARALDTIRGRDCARWTANLPFPQLGNIRPM